MPRHPLPRLTTQLGAALAVATALTAVTATPAHADPVTFYVNPHTTAAAAVQAYPATASKIKVIANTAQAEWVTVPGSATNVVAARVSSYVGAATAAGSMPVITLYAIPGRDCGGTYSAGGLTSPAAYQAWINQVSAGITDRPVAIVIEPDALTDATCLSTTKQDERFAMLKDAVYQLSANPSAYVYLDGGHSRWLSVTEEVRRMRLSGIERARGFSLNVAGFFTNREEQTYGEQVSAELDGKTYVIDTSRNGNGPAPAAPLNWCNPQGRKLGVKPTTVTGAAHNDAFLWIKHPGESDGDCRPGEPKSGQWWNAYAAKLVPTSAVGYRRVANREATGWWSEPRRVPRSPTG